MKYEVIVGINLSTLLAPAKEIEDEINKSMHSFGFEETMIVRSQLPLVITSNVVLNQAAMSKIGGQIVKSFFESMPNSNPTIESFTRIG